MNATPTQNEMRNPWEDRSALPAAGLGKTLITALVCLLTAFALPLCASMPVALGILAILFAYVVWMGRMPAAISLPLFTAAFAGIFLGGFTAGAVVLSLVVGAAALAWLLTVPKWRRLAPLLPIAGAVLSFLFVNDIRISLIGLAFLPAGLLLAVAARLCKRRSAAICFAIAGLLISVLVAAALWIYKTCGALNLDVIKAYIDSLRQLMLDFLISTRDQLLEIAQKDGGEQAQELSEQIAEVMTLENLRTIVTQLFNLIPALVVVACSIIAFEAQSFLLAMYHNTGFSAVVTPEARVFTMSPVSAVVYTVAFVVTIFAPVTSMASAVAQTFSLILLPGFCLLGLQFFLPLLAHSRGGTRFFLIFICVAMLCCSPSNLLYILAMWGAYNILVLPLRLKMLKRMAEEGTPDDRFQNDQDKRNDHNDDQDKGDSN